MSNLNLHCPVDDFFYLNIEISEQNYKRLVEIKEKTESESLDEVIDWLIDFWLSWSEKGEEIPK